LNFGDLTKLYRKSNTTLFTNIQIFDWKQICKWSAIQYDTVLKSLNLVIKSKNRIHLHGTVLQLWKFLNFTIFVMTTQNKSVKEINSTHSYQRRILKWYISMLPCFYNWLKKTMSPHILWITKSVRYHYGLHSRHLHYYGGFYFTQVPYITMTFIIQVTYFTKKFFCILWQMFSLFMLKTFNKC